MIDRLNEHSQCEKTANNRFLHTSFIASLFSICYLVPTILFNVSRTFFNSVKLAFE